MALGPQGPMGGDQPIGLTFLTWEDTLFSLAGFGKHPKFEAKKV